MTFEKEIEDLKAAETYRILPQYDDTFLDFSSNDYLNLSKNAEVIKAGYEAALKCGAGSTGSRLLSGNKSIFAAFEEQIARDKNTEAALIFNSGFQANSGVLSAILNKDSIVIFDKLNHASMYQGVFLSGARLLRYNHLDYERLENLLKENSGRGKNVLIASETVFGMDGDRADLNVLTRLADQYNTMLYLDEAHATGLQGVSGYGLSTSFNLDPHRTIIMGTFSKALGSMGAYVASGKTIIDYLIQKSKSFIYSTALSPFCVGAAACAWRLIKGMSGVREALLDRSRLLRERLRTGGYNVLGDKTNIIPIAFSTIQEAKAVKEKLMRQKMIVSLIRKPTSPTPRIRLALNAGHTDEHIHLLLRALSEN